MQSSNPPAPRCRPGDLAIMVRAVNPENIGAIVMVVREAKGAERPWVEEPGVAWIVSSPVPLLGWRKDGSRKRARIGSAYDRYLQPIRGPREPAEEPAEELTSDIA